MKIYDKSEVKKDKIAGKSHDGRVVSITDAKLVMTNMEGKEEHMHALTADAKVTCDGKVCKAADLKPGMRIRVTTGFERRRTRHAWSSIVSGPSARARSKGTCDL